jgi:hypothetical protein
MGSGWPLLVAISSRLGLAAAGPVLEQGNAHRRRQTDVGWNLAAGYIPRTFDVQVCSTVELPSVVRTVKGIGPNCPAMLA